MSMVLLIILRAPSTTTMVPSSRYATPWLYSLPSRRMKTRMVSPGQHDGLQRIGQLIHVQNLDALQRGDFVQIEIVGDDFRVVALGQLDQLQIDFGDLREIVFGDLHFQVRHLLDALQHFEAAAPALALQRIGGIGDELQFVQNELRDDDACRRGIARRRYPPRDRR